jgi:small subunit ribosomal protein S16
MAVRIRLKRMGRRNRAFYRIVAADSRAQRDGRAIERLGHYDPFVEDEQKKVVIEKERIEHWLSLGARPTPTVESMLRTRGVQFPDSMKGKTKPKAEKKQRKKTRRPGKPRAKMSLRKAKKAKKGK